MSRVCERGGEVKRRILIGQSVPPPFLEWHSDVLSCHLRILSSVLRQLCLNGFNLLWVYLHKRSGNHFCVLSCNFWTFLKLCLLLLEHQFFDPSRTRKPCILLAVLQQCTEKNPAKSAIQFSRQN
jgi:hypothetical protein